MFTPLSLKRLIAATLLVGSSALIPQVAQAQTQIYGTGASFQGALFRQWFNQYGVLIDPLYSVIPCGSFGNTDYSVPVPPLPCSNPIVPGVQFFYASSSSGNGKTSFINNTRVGTVASSPDSGIPFTSYPRLDFAGISDAVSQSDYNTYLTKQAPTRGALIEVPAVAGPIVLPFSNIPGVTLPTIANPNYVNNPILGTAPLIPQLKLTRKAYCGIFTGAITSWGDPELTKYNTALKNSTAPLYVVRRSDSAGATTALTTHLREVCDGANGIALWTGGAGGTVTWPAQANFRSSTTNPGMANEILNPAFPGSIGYLTADFTNIAPSPAISPAPLASYLQNDASFKAVLADTTGATKPKFYPPAAKNVKAGIPTTALPTGGGSSNTIAGQTFNHTPATPAIVDGSGIPCASCIIQTLPNPTAASAYPILTFGGFLFYQKYPAFDIGGAAIPTDVPSKLINLVTKYTHLSPVTATTGSSTDADDVATLEGFTPLTPALKKQVRDLISKGTFLITN